MLVPQLYRALYRAYTEPYTAYTQPYTAYTQSYTALGPYAALHTYPNEILNTYRLTLPKQPINVPIPHAERSEGGPHFPAAGGFARRPRRARVVRPNSFTRARVECEKTN